MPSRESDWIEASGLYRRELPYAAEVLSVPYNSNNTPTRRINECTCIENLDSDDDDLNCDESFEPTRDCKKNESDYGKYSPYEKESQISGPLLLAK